MDVSEVVTFVHFASGAEMKSDTPTRSYGSESDILKPLLDLEASTDLGTHTA